MLFNGSVGATGWGKPDSGEHQHQRDADDGEAGFGLDDYIEPHRCSRKSSGSRRGRISEIRRSRRERLSGIEGAERKDFDDREAGIAQLGPLAAGFGPQQSASAFRSDASWFDRL